MTNHIYSLLNDHCNNCLHPCDPKWIPLKVKYHIFMLPKVCKNWDLVRKKSGHFIVGDLWEPWLGTASLWANVVVFVLWYGSICYRYQNVVMVSVSILKKSLTICIPYYLVIPPIGSVWLRPTNGRWRYNVTSSLIGWAQSQNDPCV